MPVSDRSAPTTGRGIGAVLGEEFSLQEAVGGVRGLAESVIPGLVFVVVFLASRALAPALVTSLAVAVVAVLLRLAQRTPVAQSLSGIVGIAISTIWAWRSGQAQNFYALSLWTNGAYLAACVVSVALRWPLVGIVVGLVRDQSTAWRTDRALVRVFQWATWLWAAMFAIRLAVKLPLYFRADVGWLAAAHLALGIPLWALTLWLTWLLVRNAGVVPAVPSPPPRP